MKKLINLGIDIGAALLVIGIISFFLVGGPKEGNPKVATKAITTVAITEVKTTESTTKFTAESTTESTTEPTTEPTTEVETTTKRAEETTTKVVESTTKKEVVTATAAPNVRAKSGNSKYSEEDIYLFAQILYCEAGGESKEEMARVGQVVLNRINTDYWEFEDVNTFYEVVTQKGQYPETWAKIRRGIKPSEDAIEVAEGLVNGTIDSGLGEDVYWQTGFVPDWNARVILKTRCDNGYHYYSVLAD